MSKVAIIGIGYIGENMMNSFNNGEYDVVGFDVSNDRISLLKEKYPNYNFTCDQNDLKGCDLFCVSVPTLLNSEKNNIDTTPLKNVKKMLLDIAKEGSSIVIESSIYVGGTRELFLEFIDKKISVGFSPERCDPGRHEPTHKDIPKVISGLNKESLDKIKFYYEKVFKTVVPVSSTECAEMCKLHENCFRLVNIAYANEISDLCKNYNINPYEMIEAAKTKPFGFMGFTPGLGIGGHCIPVNPYYIEKGNFSNLPLLHSSLKTMENRPKHKANEIMMKNKNASNYLVIGAGFKPGELTICNSPGMEISNIFSKNGKDVTVYDPVVFSNKFSNSNKNKNVQSLFEYINPFSTKVKELKWLNPDDFTLENVFKKYDVIVVSIKQNDVDWGIVNMYERLGKNVYWFIEH